MNQQSIHAGISAFVVFGLSGCAQINDTALSLFSSNVGALAVVDGQQLQGEMQVFPNRSGLVKLRAIDVAGLPAGPLAACTGRMHYTSASTGSVDLRCNGGVVADISVSVLSETRGYGYGNTANGTARLAYGLSEIENKAHLSQP